MADARAPLLVVFDLDGTLTRCDTLLPYVWGYLLRHPFRLPRLLGVLPAAVRFVFGGQDPAALKSAFIRATLGGVQRAELQAWTARFIERLREHGLRRSIGMSGPTISRASSPSSRAVPIAASLHGPARMHVPWQASW